MNVVYRRILALVLTILVLSALLLPSSAAVPQYEVSASYASGEYYQKLLRVQLTGDMRRDIVAVAESQIGYHEGYSLSSMSGSSSGSGNYTEYNNYIDYYNRTVNGWSGTLQTGGWCGMFVSFCAYMAGIGDDVLPKSGEARTYAFGFTGSKVTKGSSYVGFHDLMVKGGSYLPLPGDIIFYATWNSPTQYASITTKHIGIVQSCDVTYAPDGSVSQMVLNTIEGNTSDKVSNKHWTVKPDSSGYVYSNTYIAGFGIPNYQTTLSRSYSCYDIGAYGGSLLRLGSSGSAVTTLQVALTKAAALTGGNYSCPVTGTFSADTERAVRAFQTAGHLEVDGIVGSGTWGALRGVLVQHTNSIDSDFVMDGGKLVLYTGYGAQVVLPESCTSIEPYAFYLAEGITSLTVPKTLRTVAANAFTGCAAIPDVIFAGSETQAAKMNVAAAGNGFFLSNMRCVPKTYEVTFKTAEGIEKRSFAEDTLPSYSCPAQVEKDGMLYNFIGWNRAFTPVTANASYTAQYYTTTASPASLRGDEVTSRAGAVAELPIRIDDLSVSEISSFSFTVDYTAYTDVLTYEGVSDALSGLTVDASVPGILTVRKADNGKTFIGSREVLNLKFRVSQDAPEDSIYLFFGDALLNCTAEGKEFPLNVLSEFGVIDVTAAPDTFAFESFDYDGENGVSINDVTCLLNILSGAADGTSAANADLSINDVTLLLNYLSAQ